MSEFRHVQIGRGNKVHLARFQSGKVVGKPICGAGVCTTGVKFSHQPHIVDSAITCKACLDKQRILDRRAAAGLLDADVASATMTEARKAISARLSEWDDCAACGHMRKCHDPVCYVDDCNGTCTFIEQQDFSAANDSALFAADQYDDWRDWQWSIGDTSI